MSEHDESVQVRQLLRQATDLLILGGYAAYNPRKRKENEILARSQSPEVLAAAVSAVAFTEGDRVAWMTPGSPTVVFLDGRKVLAGVRCLFPGYIRCHELWDGDVPLVNGQAFLDLLHELAIDSARERIDGDQSPVEVARFVRAGFTLSPGRAYRVLRTVGVPYVASKEAVDETLSETESRSTTAARADAVEVLDDPSW